MNRNEPALSMGDNAQSKDRTAFRPDKVGSTPGKVDADRTDGSPPNDTTCAGAAEEDGELVCGLLLKRADHMSGMEESVVPPNKSKSHTEEKGAVLPDKARTANQSARPDSRSAPATDAVPPDKERLSGDKTAQPNGRKDTIPPDKKLCQMAGVRLQRRLFP